MVKRSNFLVKLLQTVKIRKNIDLIKMTDILTKTLTNKVWIITLGSIHCHPTVIQFNFGHYKMGNDHEIEFCEIESLFFQEIKRKIIISKVVFLGDQKFL